MDDLDRLITAVILMVISWPLFAWLFPYTIHVSWDEYSGWHYRIERKPPK